MFPIVESVETHVGVPIHLNMSANSKYANRIYDGVEAKTIKSQASFQII